MVRFQSSQPPSDDETDDVTEVKWDSQRAKRLVARALGAMAKALDDIERIQRDQTRQEREFKDKMRLWRRREPKPEDYGLPPGWQSKDHGMGEWHDDEGGEWHDNRQ